MRGISRISQSAIARTAAGLLAIAAIFYIVAWGRSERGAIDEAPLGRAPEFVLKDYGGKEVTHTDIFGKPALIHVWASWCPFCREELENLAEIKKEFGEAITIVAINRAESRDIAASTYATLGTATGTVLLLDPDDTYYSTIGGFAMPETIFTDPDGNIVFHKRGPQTLEELRRLTEDVIAR
ncbi:MAG: alkyl hydroperoxide reductase [Parcubacteria group bacterium Greene0714_36]|nr:MAG: alkyl hydroperoxide reductase [Parcubacteria group bacterium Greene0714_36]